SDLLAHTKNASVKYLHCLPAIHDTSTNVGQQFHAHTGLSGAEVSHEVFVSPASLVFDQAENRMHTIKAVLIRSLAEQPDADRLSTGDAFHDA
ncbi:MAG: hypothetical protein ACRDRA_16975, partial [Pseudonocardiaceae bacterium]